MEVSLPSSWASSIRETVRRDWAAWINNFPQGETGSSHLLFKQGCAVLLAYGIWCSETPKNPLRLEDTDRDKNSSQSKPIGEMHNFWVISITKQNSKNGGFQTGFLNNPLLCHWSKKQIQSCFKPTTSFKPVLLTWAGQDAEKSEQGLYEFTHFEEKNFNSQIV